MYTITSFIIACLIMFAAVVIADSLILAGLEETITAIITP